MARTVTVEPHWPSVRAYVRELAKTDRAAALRVAAAMGSEAPPELMADGPATGATC